MKVFVAGATGKTGQNIVRQLVAQGFQVKALVRNLELAKTNLPSETEFVVGDLLNLQGGLLSDCSALICATGARPSLNPLGPWQVDLLGTKNLVNLAKSEQLEHFILVSSLCVSRLWHPLNLFWLVLWWKKQAEKYLIASGLNYTIVRPGGLKMEDSSDGVVMTAADTLFEGSIPRPKVAAVCVAALSCPEARGKIAEVVAKPGIEALSWSQLFANIA